MSGIANVRLYDGRVDPCRARPEMRISCRLLDHDTGDLLHDLCSQPASELPDCRLLRHALIDRDLPETTQCNESETSLTSVSYPQPVRCLTTINRTNIDGRP